MNRIALVSILILVLTAPATAGDRVDLNGSQINLITKLTNQGLLEIEPSSNRAMINPQLWAQMKYSTKQDFSAALAIYCGNEKGTYKYWVEVFDQYSGKKLAKYSQHWGFDVY